MKEFILTSPAREPIAHSEKRNPAQTKREWEAMGARADTVRQKRRNTLSSVFWSGCRAVTEFICQSHHLHHQDLIQNTFELRPVDTAKIQNSNSRQKWGRHGVPTNGLNPRQTPRVQEFSTLRVARRLPMQIHKW